MRLTIRHFLSTFDRVSLIYIIVSPVFFIFILGYGIGGIIPDFELGGTKVSYTLFLAAGIIPYAVINSGMASGMLLWIDRKNGMFEQILMGPFTRTQYIASLIISTIFAGLVSAGVVFVLALPVIAGATLTLAGFVYAGLTIVLGSLFFGSLAIILSIRVKSSESFQLLINFLFFLLVFTSSVFYPVEKAPSVI